MLDDIIKQINKEFKKELAIKGIGQLVLKRIPFTSPRLNYITYGGIPRGRITMFAGRESSGKSTTALDIVKNAQLTFKQEYEQEVQELSNKIFNFNNILTDKESPKAKKEQARKELPELQQRLTYLQKRGILNVVYFDAEGTIDADWAEKIGVDIDQVYLIRLHTQTAEQFLDQVMKVVRDTDDVGLVVIDSIAVLVPQLVHGQSFEQKSMGGNSKVVTDFCNEVCPILGEKDIACVIINQARDDFKNPYADFSIPCGNGLKLASSLILTFQKGSLLDESGNEQKKSYDRPQGNLVWVRIQKTKIFKPDRRVGFYTLNYDYGVDVVADLLPLAVEYGLIKKAGSWFSIINQTTGQVELDENGNEIKLQGQVNMMQYIREHEYLLEYIYEFINAAASNNGQQLQISAEEDLKAIEEINDISQEQINNEVIHDAEQEVNSIL